MKQVKIGLIGLGYFGSFHLNNILKTKFNLTGFYDSDKKKAMEIEKKTGIKKYDNPESLIKDVDVIDITTPTIYHYELIRKAILAGKHVFVEKPMTSNSEQALAIVQLLQNSDLKLQVGHIERFNPAIDIEELRKEKIINIEANRLSTYNPRGTDVSVVFDLMIHDIDLILAIMGDKIKSIEASGLMKYGDNIEFGSASLTFEKGNKAILNSSIIHPYMERKLKIWTTKGVYELDLAKKEINKYFYSLKPDKENNIFAKTIYEKKDTNNSILDELNEFYYSIIENKPTKVNAKDGYKAVKLAEDILNKIKT